MAQLVSTTEAARIIGTTTARVREWARRAEDPLPSIPSESGRFLQIITAEIEPWLVREAKRQTDEREPPPARPR